MQSNHSDLLIKAFKLIKCKNYDPNFRQKRIDDNIKGFFMQYNIQLFTSKQGMILHKNPINNAEDGKQIRI